MTQPDKKTFLGKLARFVSNPTTSWAALEGGEQHPDLPPDSVLTKQDEAGALSQAELLQIQRQRRKRNRRIREKEFAMLRQIRAGARIPGAHTNLNSDMLADAALPPPDPAAAKKQKLLRPASKFDINRIDKVEQQMTKQWWSHELNPSEVAQISMVEKSQTAPDSVMKTQIMFDSPAAPAEPEQGDQGDIIAFDPGLFALPEQTAQIQQGEFRPMRNSAHANGTGENVNLPEADQSGTISFVYENPPSQLMEDFQPPPAEKNPDSPEPALLDEVYVPLSADDAYLMAESDDIDATVQKMNMYGVESAAYTPGNVEQLPEALNEPAILFAQNRDDEARNQLRTLADACIALAKQKQKSEPDALLALLDLYRATRQEDEFENASIELVQYFERAAPRYRDADRAQATRILSSFGMHTEVGEHEQANWCAPAKLGLNEVMLLRSQLVGRKPLQVLLDWRPLQTILDDAIEPLLDQFRDLAGRKVEVLMWGGDHLLECCKRQLEKAARPACLLLWLLRLEVVRIMYGQQEFDALALEYCVALEQSPPSWEPVRCQFINADLAVRLIEDGDVDADVQPDGKSGSVNHPYQWQGELAGSIQALLKALEAEKAGSLCVIDCMQLDRMDYTASAELLNWLISQDGNMRHEVRFIHVNRLLAVFWRIVGVTSKAVVELRLD